jgi:hypothetical protein
MQIILPQIYTDEHRCQLSEILGDAYFLHSWICTEFSQISDGLRLALSARSDDSGCNNQTTLQARATTTKDWSSI